MKNILVIFLLMSITLSAVVPEKAYFQDKELTEVDDIDERESEREGGEEEKKAREKDAIEDFSTDSFDPCRFASNLAAHFDIDLLKYNEGIYAVTTPPPEHA